MSGDVLKRGASLPAVLHNEARAQWAQRELGGGGPIGTPFRCRLPSHQKNCWVDLSAADGEPRLVCDCLDIGGPPYRSLAVQLAAERHAKADKHRVDWDDFSSTELKLWNRLIDYEAGCSQLTLPAHRPLLGDATRRATNLLEALRRLAAVREGLAVDEQLKGAFPASYRFAGAWSETSKSTADRALKELERHGVIERRGELALPDGEGRATVYSFVPVDSSAARPASRDVSSGGTTSSRFSPCPTPGTSAASTCGENERAGVGRRGARFANMTLDGLVDCPCGHFDAFRWQLPGAVEWVCSLCNGYPAEDLESVIWGRWSAGWIHEAKKAAEAANSAASSAAQGSWGEGGAADETDRGAVVPLRSVELESVNFPGPGAADTGSGSLKVPAEPVRRQGSGSGAFTQPEELASASSGLVDAAAIARMVEMSAAWVRANGSRLGGIKVGNGPRPRWRFDPEKALRHFRELGAVAGVSSAVLPARESVERFGQQEIAPRDVGASGGLAARKGPSPRSERSCASSGSPDTVVRPSASPQHAEGHAMEKAIEDAFWVRPGKKGQTWAMRIPVDGRRRYLTLGRDYGPEAMSEQAARFKCGQLLGQIELGTFVWPSGRGAATVRLEHQDAEAATYRMPLFGEVAKQWFAQELVTAGRTRKGLSESGRLNKEWLLRHVNEAFGELRVDTIDEAMVEDFAISKRERHEAVSVNKMLNTIEKVMKRAIRRRVIDRNPVDGFRLPVTKFTATHLETAAQIEALMEAAGELDLTRRVRRGHGRALVAVLVLAGLRIGELRDLRWRDVYLAKNYLYVRGTKTENAERRVALVPRLRTILAELKALRGGQPSDYVFGTSKGGRENRSNVSQRILAPAVESANKLLTEQDEEPIRDGLTPHGLRHTYISAMLALGVDVITVGGEVGHRDKASTLNRYGKPMRRAPGDMERLEALYRGDVEERRLKAVA